jgi:hypothetical protein
VTSGQRRLGDLDEVATGVDLDHFRAIAEQLARQLPRPRHVALLWAGHVPNLERPDEVTTLLIDFHAEPISPPESAGACTAEVASQVALADEHRSRDRSELILLPSW